MKKVAYILREKHRECDADRFTNLRNGKNRERHIHLIVSGRLCDWKSRTEMGEVNEKIQDPLRQFHAPHLPYSILSKQKSWQLKILRCISL